MRDLTTREQEDQFVSDILRIFKKQQQENEFISGLNCIVTVQCVVVTMKYEIVQT